jgi:hypothetical protein
MAELAPIAKAMVTIEVTVNAGLLRSVLAAYLKSRKDVISPAASAPAATARSPKNWTLIA